MVGCLLLTCGCIEPGRVRIHFNVPEAAGHPADAKIGPGRYDGYEVIGRCQPLAWTQHRMMIRGLGSRQIASPTADGWTDAMVAFRARAEKALVPLALMVWYEGGCLHDGYVLNVYVARYGQVDAAIVRLGALLRDENLGDEVHVVLSSADRPSAVYRTIGMPLARRPFFPYEASLTAGARYHHGWERAFALHVGAIWGRETSAQSKAGWFWGLGLDGRIVPDAADARCSAGPSVRFGRAFGTLAPHRPGPVTNRGTYVYGQVGTEWAARGPVVVASVGLTSLALAEGILSRYRRTANQGYPLLFPLALLDHVELDWEMGTHDGSRSKVALLLGFSL